MWNELPEDIRVITSIIAFKSQLDLFVQEPLQQYLDWCSNLQIV